MPERLNPEKVARVSLTPKEIAWRSLWRYGLLNYTFRTQIVWGMESLDVAADFRKRTGRGIIVRFIHFSESDPTRTMLATTTHPNLRNVRIVGPFAYHQYKKHPFLIGQCVRAGVELFPVVTAKTMELCEENGNPEGLYLHQGVSEYMKRSQQVIAGGGLDMSAPQGTRQAKLLKWEEPVMWAYATAMRRAGIDNFGILHLAFEIPGYSDYSKLDGLNLEKRPHVARFSEFTTLQDALNQLGGKAKGLDDWSFEKLQALSAPSYQ